jgi:hypothetical protein
MAPLPELCAPVQLVYKIVNGHNLEVDIYVPYETKPPSLGHPLCMLYSLYLELPLILCSD